MQIKWVSRGLLFLFLPLFLAASGCGATASLTRKILPESWATRILPGRPNLKHRVMVFPFLDKAGLGPEQTAKYSRQFYELLKGSPNLLISDPPDGMFSSLAIESPQFGVVSNSSMVDFAQAIGMNQIVIGVLNPVETDVRRTGIWPFDKWKKIFGISVAVNVIDTVSKTLLLTHVETKDFPVPLEEAEELDEKGFVDQASAEALPELIKKEAEVVRRELSAQPWTGTVLAVEDKTVMINAGKEIGLEPGKSFEVFAVGKTISSAAGRTVYLLGEKVGVIKATSVMETQSLAEPVSGGPFEPKQVVRFKP